MSAVIAEHEIQGSDAWHEYRRTRGGASEAAALMGVSPYFPRTAYELAQVKLGHVEVDQTPAMARGTRLEPAARAAAEDLLGEVFEPQVLEGPSRMVASLDGLSFHGRSILELKVPMKGRESETWQHVAQHGTPPDGYWWQVQQQLLCSGAGMCFFAVCEADENEEITDAITCEVLPDMQAHQALRAAWDAFWQKLDAGDMPDMTERDVVERDDEEWAQAVQAWRQAKAEADAATAALKEAAKALHDLAGERSAKGFGVRVSRFYKAGSIDYRKALGDVPEDELERYRKKGGYQYRITAD